MRIKAKLFDSSPKNPSETAPQSDSKDKRTKMRALQYIAADLHAKLAKDKADELERLDKEELDSIRPLTDFENDVLEMWQKKPTSFPWRNYMVYLVILTSLSACFTFSKYVTQSSGDAVASVAKFNVSVSGDLSVSPVTNDVVFTGYLADSQQTFSLNVKNDSEVSVNVETTVTDSETYHTMSLDCENLFLLLPNEQKTINITVNKNTVPSNMLNQTLTDSANINFAVSQKD